MTEANQPSSREATATPHRVSVVGEDRVQVEFRIDDLVNQLMRQSFGRPEASCNGCNGCSN